MGLFSIFGKSNTLYFPGCTTYFKFKENFEIYQKIFSRLGIGFKIIDKKICCGLPALEAGYDKEARKLARRNFEIFKEEGVTDIITTSPKCYKMFLLDYPVLLPDFDIGIRNIWEIILDELKSRPRLIKNKAMEIVTYHDSCYLSRYCGIYDEPREILELIGYEIKEMPDSKLNSVCCGRCGGLTIINPELSDKIAKQRILQAKRIGVKKMIVSSFDNYQILKKNSKDEDIEIFELSEVLMSALNIKKKQPWFEEETEEDEESEEEEIIIETKANIKLEEELKEEDIYDGGRIR